MKWSRAPLRHGPDGVIWPAHAVPCQVQILVREPDVVEVLQSAEIIYRDLQMHGLNVLLDDRRETFEVKGRDADRLRIPVRILIDTHALQRDEVEISVITSPPRAGEQVRIDHCVERVEELVNELAAT